MTMTSSIRYAVKMRAALARNGREVIVPEGTWFWVLEPATGPEGGEEVEADKGRMPHRVRTWATAEEAEAFARQLPKNRNGLAWYWKPDGSIQVFPVRPRMVQQGWERATDDR
jgi:hypothetical protein